MSNIFYATTLVRIEAEVLLYNGDGVAPSSLTFTMIEPDDVQTVVTYTEPEAVSGHKIIRKVLDEDDDPIVGKYAIDWPGSKIGEHRFFYQANGNAIVSGRGAFTIKRTL